MGFFDKFGKKSNDDTPDNVKGKVKAKHRIEAPIVQFELMAFLDKYRGMDCTIHEDGRTKYLGLVLPFEAIGGLEKGSKDMDKTALVSAINEGTIASFFDDTLDQEQQVFIAPDYDSLMRMHDMIVLKEVVFAWATIDDKGEVEAYDGKTVRMSELATIKTADEWATKLSEVMGRSIDSSNVTMVAEEPEPEYDTEDPEYITEDPEDPEDEVESEKEPVNTAGDFITDDDIIDSEDDPNLAGIYNPNGEQADSGNEGFGSTDLFDESVGVGNDGNGPVFSTPGEGEVVEQVVETPMFDPVSISENGTINEQVIKTALHTVTALGDKGPEMNNQFLIDILEKEFPQVQLKPYPIVAHASEKVNGVAYAEPTSYLNNEANRIISRVNESLVGLHQQAASEILEYYSKREAQISNNMVMLFGTSGSSAESKAVIEARQLTIDQDKVDAELEEYRKQREEMYVERRNRYVESKMNEITEQFDKQNRAAHSRTLEEEITRRRKELESVHTDKVHEAEDARWMAAEAALDGFVSELQTEVKQMVRAKLQKLNELRDDALKNIADFMDNHRDTEAQRIATLKRELDISTALQDAEIKYDTSLKNLRAEHLVDTERLQSRIDAATAEVTAAHGRYEETRQRHTSEIKRLTSEMDSKSKAHISEMSEMKAREREMMSEVTEAREQLAVLDSVRREVNQREKEIEDWKHQVEVVSQTVSRNRSLFIAVALVAAVASGLIGLLLGITLFGG